MGRIPRHLLSGTVVKDIKNYSSVFGEAMSTANTPSYNDSTQSHPETLVCLLQPSLSRSELVRDGHPESASCWRLPEDNSEPIAMASLGGG